MIFYSFVSFFIQNIIRQLHYLLILLNVWQMRAFLLGLYADIQKSIAISKKRILERKKTEFQYTVCAICSSIDKAYWGGLLIIFLLHFLRYCIFVRLKITSQLLYTRIHQFCLLLQSWQIDSLKRKLFLCLTMFIRKSLMPLAV